MKLGARWYFHKRVSFFLSMGGGERGWLPSMHHRSHDQKGLRPRGKGVCIQGAGQTSPPPVLQDTVNKRVFIILLECILVLLAID